MQKFEVNAIGRIRTDGGEMFIELDPKFAPSLHGLDGFSHLNVIWWFSQTDGAELREILDMSHPYKKGPEIMGVFATRSPIRPNPIALSAVPVVHIEYEKTIIQIGWIDAEDGTPVLDIKPYTPSADVVERPEVPDWCSHWPKNLEQSGDFDWLEEFDF